MLILSLALFAGAGVGMTLLLVQLGSSWRHLRERPARPLQATSISILKPLCGHDDDLEANLEAFATLPYPRYELLLGVRSRRDGAYPYAIACAARHPDRVRVCIQRGEPGLNPKVNQLITLARAARNDVLVVSDSNVEPPAGYLDEIAAELDDSRVGLVTHPVVGVGERTLGSLLDNLHLAGSVGAGMIGAKRVARKDLVVGKSIAIRRADLEQLGGFACVADVLAEDFVMGKMIPTRLGKRVAMGRRPIRNVSRSRSVRDFVKRYQRWAVIHRNAVGTRVFTAQVLLNPLAVSLMGWAVHPTAVTGFSVAALGTLKIAYDVSALKLLGGSSPSMKALVASPLKDLLLLYAWAHGLATREIVWRSNKLRVLPGTRLQLPDRAESTLDEESSVAA
jgi:ceramide glucosyltransferase